MMRRLPVIALCLSLPLAACSSDPGSDYESVFTMARDYFAGAPPISLDQAAAVPYASIGVRIGDGPQVLLVLATQNGDDTMWVAGRSVAIAMHDGRIVRTSGLAENVTNVWRAPAGRIDPTAPPTQAWGDSRPVTWFADYAELKRYSVSITCTSSQPVEDPVTILGKSIPTVRVEEHCAAPDLDWTYTNRFWLDPSSGFVWRSEQHVRPDFDPLVIDVLRPPAG
jgi:hypothetical protein